MTVENFRALHPALRRFVLRSVIRDCRGSLAGITTRHLEEVERLCRGKRSGRRVALPDSGIAIRELGNLLVMRSGIPPVQFCCALAVPGECAIPEIGIRIAASFQDLADNSLPKPDSTSQAMIDTAAVPESLTVRSRLPGDRYGGPPHRKVKKMLINAKLPSRTRDRLPLVVAGDAVIWIPGFRPAKSFAVRPGSRRCIMLQLKPALGPP